MGLYYKAGARYFVAQAMHHDNFFNYPSRLNRMNSMEVGPHKDICGLWKKAADKYHLPFGLTEHLSASFSWWKTNKGADRYGPYKGVPYDGNDVNYRDFYHDNYEHFNYDDSCMPWYTQNPKFQRHWLDVMKELIGLFTPDLLYSDGSLPFGSHWDVAGHPEAGYTHPGDRVYRPGLEAVACLYNKSIEKYGENRAVYTQKDRRPEIYRIGILDVEKSQLPDVSPDVWQTDTCIGNWFYDAKQEYKKPDQIIEMLVDIVSKNGTMLLNILQRPDGTIDEQARFILDELAGWYSICGEAICGTRPFRVSGEGENRVKIQDFVETKGRFTGSDWRFTAKGSAIYAFMMAPPENGAAVIKSISEKIAGAVLLGYGKLDFAQSFGVLTLKLPPRLPTGYINCIRLEKA